MKTLRMVSPRRIPCGMAAWVAVLSAMLLLAGCPWDSGSSTPRPPTLSGLSDVTVDAGAGGTETFTLTGAGTLSVTASSSNQTLLPDSGITGQGACTGAGPCMLTLTPAANQSGSATVTVTVTDSRGRSASDSFVFTVNPPPQVSKIIGTSGGDVGFDDGSFKITIPPGALTQDTEIVITQVSGNDIPAELQDPLVQRVYKMEPDGLQFATPATVTVHMAGSPAPPDGAPLVLLISDSQGTLEGLTPLTNAVDDTGLTVTAPINHFSSVSEAEVTGFSASAEVTPASVPYETPSFTVTIGLTDTEPRIIDSAEGGVDLNSNGPILLDSTQTTPALILVGGGSPTYTGTVTGKCLDSGTGEIFSHIGFDITLNDFASGAGPESLVHIDQKVTVDCLPQVTPPPPPSSWKVPLGLSPTPGGLVISQTAQVLGEAFADLGGDILFDLSDGSGGYGIFDGATKDVKRVKSVPTPSFCVGDLAIVAGAGVGGYAAVLIEQAEGDSSIDNYDATNSSINNYGATTGQWSNTLITVPGAVRDASLAGDSLTGAEMLFVQDDGVHFIAQDPADGMFKPTSEVIPASELGGLPISAFEAQAQGGGPLLVVSQAPDSGTAVAPGRLIFVPRDGSTPIDVGRAGSRPSNIRCLNGICGVTGNADNSLTIVLWDGLNMPVIVGATTVGYGPHPLDLATLSDGNTVIGTTSAVDGTYTLTEVAADGSVMSNTTQPVDDGCGEPWAITFFDDSEGKKALVTCIDTASIDVLMVEAAP